nr:putative RNA-directed DNA polymerase, eukaryota, reverse transcriptase zinc-binding domain protein [Tanacetum cinerariifolium]
MRNKEAASWDLGQIHMGRSGQGVGTVQMSCRCTGGSMGEGVVLAGKEVRRELFGSLGLWHLWLAVANIALALFNKSIEEKIEAGFTNDDDHDLRIKFLQEVDKLDTFESFALFQKARAKWDIDGDENPKFFHGLITQKRRAQMIHNIMKEEEVKNAVWDYGSSKVPGPDGFSFAFVKKYWDDMKVDILEFVNIFLDTGFLPHVSNSSFFTFIPKSLFIIIPDSVLVNSSLTLEFSIKRGLRQGVPLLSFLFILVMEGFHNALSIAVSSSLIRGIKFGSPEIAISHLFYADDMIITAEWIDNDLDNIIRVLRVFYIASGLKINIQKSNVYGIGVSDVDVSFIACNS